MPNMTDTLWRILRDTNTDIGIDDSFLDLGGNSLQAMRIAAQVQEQLGVEVQLVEFFVAKTVSEMALYIAAKLMNKIMR